MEDVVINVVLVYDDGIFLVVVRIIEDGYNGVLIGR